jgi:cytochrome c peroxidase
MKKIIIIVIVCCVFVACTYDKGLPPKQPTPITFNIPAGWPATQYNFTANPLTEEGLRLGRKLFYDKRLSVDGTVNCGTCHEQAASFVLYDHDLGHGINNEHTLRNPQPLINLAWRKEMTWDGGAGSIESQIINHITAPNEMGETISGVLAKLQADTAYRRMFRDAFGDENITSARMQQAITQFLLLIVSSDSKYDRVKKGTESFSALEDIGYQVFRAKCNSCHAEPLFTDFSYRNIGRPYNAALGDKGRMRVTGNPADSLKFMVPGLRNAALTFPYTRDGTVFSPDQMADHYRFNVVNHPSTDPLVRNGITMTITEKAGVVAFIKTLTDTTVTKNVLFSAQ